MKSLLVIIMTFFLMACSDSDNAQKVEKDHVWKEQVEMIDKAKAVEQMLQDSAALQKQRIDEQTH
ncbi:MAG: hypothetical protein GQ547_03160 [Methylophaga sp.]|nr:hypothetical protein [Methylophaga sp.]